MAWGIQNAGNQINVFWGRADKLGVFLCSCETPLYAGKYVKASRSWQGWWYLVTLDPTMYPPPTHDRKFVAMIFVYLFLHPNN